MIEIFIALFGGLYLLGKFSSDKVNSRNWEKAYEKEKSIKETMVNEKFEKELAKKIADPRFKTEIEKLLHDDFQYVYGDAWKFMFAGNWGQPNTYAYPFGTHENIILLLMLSKSGLLPRQYQFQRISVGNSTVANTYEQLKLLHCVEKNIKEKRNSPSMQLHFIPEIVYKIPRTKNDPGTPDYTHPCSGEFYWDFEINPLYHRYILDIRSDMLISACKEASAGERSLASNPYKDKLLL